MTPILPVVYRKKMELDSASAVIELPDVNQGAEDAEVQINT